MEQFISEPITPGGARTDTSAMATGEPGLPAEFNWRGRTYKIAAKLQQWHRRPQSWDVAGSRRVDMVINHGK